LPTVSKCRFNLRLLLSVTAVTVVVGRPALRSTILTKMIGLKMRQKIYRFSLPAVFFLLCLFGCATGTKFQIQKYAEIDKSEKTITVAAGSDGLRGLLKQSLANDGWKMVVYRGVSVTEGKIGEKTRVEQYETYSTRYRLLTSQVRFDTCIPSGDAYVKYDISIVDNKMNVEVFTLSGTACDSEVAKEFQKLITK
jgi:hypothetical protein